jgi:hypothetical protein
VTSSWFFLFTLNYDARSTTHQIYIVISLLRLFLATADAQPGHTSVGSAAAKHRVYVPFKIQCSPTFIY